MRVPIIARARVHLARRRETLALSVLVGLRWS